eukprot:TCONS_00011304-protein
MMVISFTCIAIVGLIFVHPTYGQGPCGGRLCLEYTSGVIKETEDGGYNFLQTKGYDFMIEFSFTTFNSREELVEMVVKHNEDILISGDRKRFRSLYSNLKSTTGRYGSYLTIDGTFVFLLLNMNDKYAEGIYTITAFYKTKFSKKGDEHFEQMRFSFGIKVNGGYTPWTNFGKCSKECDVGQMRRSRECTNPEPKFGGLDCRHLGPKADRFPCFNVPCSNLQIEKDPVLENFSIKSKKKRDISLLSMLEFGFHCFITPSENVNDETRMSLAIPAKIYSVSDGDSRALLQMIHIITRRSFQIYLHCSLAPCSTQKCENGSFITKQIAKGNIGVSDMRLSVGIDG